jgi:hypothetical protein
MTLLLLIPTFSCLSFLSGFYLAPHSTSNTEKVVDSNDVYIKHIQNSMRDESVRSDRTHHFWYLRKAIRDSSNKAELISTYAKECLSEDNIPFSPWLEIPIDQYSSSVDALLPVPNPTHGLIPYDRFNEELLLAFILLVVDIQNWDKVKQVITTIKSYRNRISQCFPKDRDFRVVEGRLEDLKTIISTLGKQKVPTVSLERLRLYEELIGFTKTHSSLNEFDKVAKRTAF